LKENHVKNSWLVQSLAAAASLLFLCKLTTHPH
jgi:hypothetical protein